MASGTEQWCWYWCLLVSSNLGLHIVLVLTFDLSGALANGYLTNLFGHRKVTLGALFMLSAFIFITFFAPSQEVLLVGQLLCGLPWGVFATTAPAYASEILPLPLRVYFTSYTNMCFIIGQLIGAGVLSGLQSRTDEVSVVLEAPLMGY